MKPIVTSAIALTCVAVILLQFEAFETSTSTLNRVLRTGEILVGYQPDAAPLSFENAAGQPAGHAIDLCRRFVAGLQARVGRPDIETRFIRIQSTNRIAAVNEGRIDIDCSPSAMTGTARNDVEFTIPTYVAGDVILSHREREVRKIHDLSRKKIGVVRDDRREHRLRRTLRERGIDPTIIVVPNPQEAMQLIDGGGIDALVGDQVTLIGQISAAATPRNYIVASDSINVRPLAWMVRKNDADFLNIANEILTGLYDNGEYDELYAAWIGRTGVAPIGSPATPYPISNQSADPGP